MRKAVAIPYIIALVMGVVVISLLGYWFIRQSGQASNVGSQTECQGKLFSYCVKWQVNGEKNPPQSFDWGNSCQDLKSKTEMAKLDECKSIGIDVK